MRHSRLRSALGSAVSVAGLILTVATPSAHASAASVAAAADATAAAPYPSPIALYAQDWNGFTLTRTTADWQRAAQTHQVLVGSPGVVYGHLIAQLHTWNPQLKVLLYDLGPYTVKGSTDYQQIAAQHPDYFARDASGALITVKAASGSPAFVNNTLMNEANPGWQAFEAQRIVANLAKWGFDGPYIDSMGPGVFTGTTTGVPMEPSTGLPFTTTSWMVAGGRALSVIKAAIGTKFLMSTGMVNGIEYQSFTHYLSDSMVDGVQTDSWLRLANSSPDRFPSARALAADLLMVQTLNDHGKSFFGWTKVWTTASPVEELAWDTYALAAYLLVDNGISDYYAFDAPFNSDRTTVFAPVEVAALGAATGPFTLVNGIYHRSFQNGTVTLDTNTNVASIA